MFDTFAVDISTEDFIPAIEEGVIDVVIKSIFSAVLIDTLFVCGVVRVLLICIPSVLIDIVSVGAVFVFDRTDDNVNGLFVFSGVVCVSPKDVGVVNSILDICFDDKIDEDKVSAEVRVILVVVVPISVMTAVVV